ncbi:hypothetical protein PoB_005774900 [Plakobranchus ocellatus]|uniref:Uncharacterized protein n=1 Tax=Plakobranchus ocellatus TaxID=259542 RepID=A0AAV4CK21_9GAST|nr:hypothetical protein PoB_005774900 [Plakobranchus ocellatus]
MQKDKEVGRKEGGRKGRLTEADRSRRTGIVTNRHRGSNVHVRAQTVRIHTHTHTHTHTKGRRKVGQTDQSRAAVGFIQRQPCRNYLRFGIPYTTDRVQDYTEKGLHMPRS